MTAAETTLPAPPEGRHGWPWTSDSAQAPAYEPSAHVPSIGVVVPSYNQAQFLEATLRSLLLQRYPRLEIVVMDAGSTDGSPAIIERYAPWLSHWVSERDKGQSDAINRGLARLQTDIVTWLNSDDLLLPGTLLAVGAYLASTPGCEWVCGDGLFVDETAAATLWVHAGRAFTFEELIDYGGGNYLAQPSVFFSKRLFDQIGGVNLDLHYAMDLDLWLRMRRLTELHYLPRRLSLLRQHSAAKTLRDNERAMHEVTRVVDEHSRGCSLQARSRALFNMRRQRAKSMSSAALQAYFDGDRKLAANKLLDSARTYPPVVAHPTFARVVARLALPQWLKARVLVRP